MKHLFGATLAILCLTACSGNTVVTYQLDMGLDDAGRQTVLSLAASRVVERRLEAMGETVADIDIQTVGDAVHLLVTVANEDTAELLTNDLREPFKLRINEETELAEADIVVFETEGYRETGITEEHVQWLEATEEANQKGRVTISFTPEGREKMAEVFSANVDGFIGLFVRDRLIAKLLVDTDELKDDIIISEIPSVALAETFADDVNVGLHVSFTRIE